MRMRKATISSLLVILLVSLTGWVSEAQIASDVIDLAITRTVLLVLVDKDGRPVGNCSGSVVSPAGLILTAAHCVRAEQDEPKLGIRKGELYNPKGWVAVGINLPDHVKPVLALVAQRVADDPQLDLALVKVAGLLAKEGIGALPADFRAPFLRLGDSDKVRIGDPVALIGFPGTGGDTVTAPQGHVTGFTADDQDHKLEMKHDANAGGGASGGPVILADGSEVGIEVGHITEGGTTSWRAVLTARLPSAWASYFKEGPGGPPSPGGGSPVPQPAPAARVVIQGTIVDADSGSGIAGATFALLRPGVSPGAASEQDVVAQGQADGRGFFQTSPGVSRGPQYPVVVLAKGYQPIGGMLPVESGGPDVIQLKPITLQRL